jgi:AraC-like DNA-binding protein/ligand-binding sensor domain-containing protein
MKRIAHLLAALVCATLTAMAQPLCTVTHYNEEAGLAQGHVTQLAQDRSGMMWFATWNGLCRFDGYEFRTFKSHVGDGCHMTTDRIRNIVLNADGNLYCRVDEQYFLFDIKTCRFSDLNSDEAKRAADEMGKNKRSVLITNRRLYRYTDSHGTEWTVTSEGRLSYRRPPSGDSLPYMPVQPLGEVRFCYPDRQGNLWLLGRDGVYKLSFHLQRMTPLPQQIPAQVRCLFVDQKQRYWVTTKEDATVRIFGSDNRLLGYLGRDGRLHRQYTRFGSPVYCIHQSPDGMLWLGTKPDGLFRLRENGEGQFGIERCTGLPDNSIYHIATDGQGRLWIATLGGGIACCESPAAGQPAFTVPPRWPKDVCGRVRFLHITRSGILLAATTEGLVIGDITGDIRNMRFHRHQKEPDRATSLSNSATMDIIEDAEGRIYISTESGGVNRIESPTLTAATLQFRHYDTADSGVPSDVALSMTRYPGGRLMVVSSTQLYLLHPDGTAVPMDSRFFHRKMRFSDARPIVLPDGRWLFGLQDGAFTMNRTQMHAAHIRPNIVITAVNIQNRGDDLAVDGSDTLRLAPHQRSLSISFAALDYSAPEHIKYFYRLTETGSKASGEQQEFHPLGHDRTVRLLDLRPGSYRLEMASTEVDGVWAGNVRTLIIEVKPRFIETPLARLLIALLVMTVVGAVVFTLLYIRRIKRQQHATLEAYLALLNRPTSESGTPMPATTPTTAAKRLSPEDDAFMRRVMHFVEEHIADADISIGDMADAAATSRSGLQRKMKQLMGVTPLDFLREARIKRACRMLTEGNRNITEVAYACGFNDPKYFSRCFKASMGCPPREYSQAD